MNERSWLRCMPLLNLAMLHTDRHQSQSISKKRIVRRRWFCKVVELDDLAFTVNSMIEAAFAKIHSYDFEGDENENTNCEIASGTPTLAGDGTDITANRFSKESWVSMRTQLKVQAPLNLPQARGAHWARKAGRMWIYHGAGRRVHGGRLCVKKRRKGIHELKILGFYGGYTVSCHQNKAKMGSHFSIFNDSFSYLIADSEFILAAHVICSFQPAIHALHQSLYVNKPITTKTIFCYSFLLNNFHQTMTRNTYTNLFHKS